MPHFALNFCAAVLLCLTMAACRTSNIREVMQRLAEQPVDTASFSRRTIQLLPFQSVDVDCFADVDYRQSPQFSVEILAPAEVVDNLQAIVADEELYVGTPRHLRLPDNVAVVVRVSAPAVNRFVLSEAKCLRLGELRLNTPFYAEVHGIGSVLSAKLEAPSAEIQLEGAGNISLHGIRTGLLKVEVEGVGNVSLEGSAQTARVAVEGTGHVDLDALHCTNPPEIRMEGVENINQKK